MTAAATTPTTFLHSEEDAQFTVDRVHAALAAPPGRTVVWMTAFCDGTVPARLPFLREALESLRTQTEPVDQVYLLCNGAGAQALHDMAQREFGPLVTSTYHAQMTQFQALVQLWTATREVLQPNDLVLMHDSDDISEPQRVSTMRQHALQHSNKLLYTGRLINFRHEQVPNTYHSDVPRRTLEIGAQAFKAVFFDVMMFVFGPDDIRSHYTDIAWSCLTAQFITYADGPALYRYRRWGESITRRGPPADGEGLVQMQRKLMLRMTHAIPPCDAVFRVLSVL